MDELHGIDKIISKQALRKIREKIPSDGMWFRLVDGRVDMTEKKRMGAIVDDLAHQVGYHAVVNLAIELGAVSYSELEKRIKKCPSRNIKTALEKMDIIQGE